LKLLGSTHKVVVRKAVGPDGVLRGHKFKVGQSVSFLSGSFDRGRTNSIYKITRLLPPESDDCQYRIKNADEAHERVVKESQLNRIA
jgi:hypothetical protein